MLNDILEMIIRRSRNSESSSSSAVPGHTIRLAAGVDTVLNITNSNGVLTAVQGDDNWGGTGQHEDVRDSWVGFGEDAYGCKYSLDNGATWSSWEFSSSSTLDLSQYGSSITGITTIVGRNTVTLSNQQITIDDSDGGSDIYVIDIDFNGGDSSSSSSSSSPIAVIGRNLYFEGGTSSVDYLISTPWGCVFTVQDSLPSGLTISQSGQARFDGTDYASDEYASFRVVVSSDGWTTTTATCHAYIYATPTQEEYCPSCGNILQDGVCTNPDCPESPDYVERCSECGEQMPNGYCENPDCPNYQGE